MMALTVALVDESAVTVPVSVAGALGSVVKGLGWVVTVPPELAAFTDTSYLVSGQRPVTVVPTDWLVMDAATAMGLVSV
jgi:hypothetical protein